MLDLWPADISHSRMRAPVTILKEQALLLDDKTKGVITASVKRLVDDDKEKNITDNNLFQYEFFIIAPSLADFHYRLFTISHGIELYPIDIKFDEYSKHDFADNNNEERHVNSERDFIDALRIIFTSKKTRKVIHAMLAQSAEVDIQ